MSILFAGCIAVAACAALAACVSASEKASFVPGPKQQLVPWKAYELPVSPEKVTGVGVVHPPGYA